MTQWSGTYGKLSPEINERENQNMTDTFSLPFVTILRFLILVEIPIDLSHDPVLQGRSQTFKMVIHGLHSWYALILRNLSSCALCLDPRRISRRLLWRPIKSSWYGRTDHISCPNFGHDFLASEHPNIRESFSR